MSDVIEYPRESLKKGDKLRWTFKFGKAFASTDGITAGNVTVTVTPSSVVAGSPVAVSGKNVQVQFDALNGIVNQEYLCDVFAVSDNGERKHLYLVLMVEPAEVPADVEATLVQTGTYKGTLQQLTAVNPTVLGEISSLPDGDPAWTRVSTGIIKGILVGAFPENKTRVLAELVAGSVGDEADCDGKRISDDEVRIYVRDIGGNLIDGFNPLYATIEVMP